MDGEDESKLHGIPEGDHEQPVDAAHVSNLVLATDVEPTLETPKSRLPRLFKREKAQSTEDPRPSVAGKVVTNVATFHDVFGILGIPTVLVLLLSAAWTFMLAAIQVHSKTIANEIMNTTAFDNHEFWLLPQPDTGIVVSSTVLLSLFGVGYASLAMMMLFFNRFKGAHRRDNHEEVATDSNTARAVTHAPENAATNKWQRALHWLHHKFDLPLEIRQHYITAMLDLPKLVFQTITLFTYLRGGFPLGIIYYYSILLLCNWLVGCYRSQRYVADPDLIIARLYYTFDLFFAVFAPLVVLIYFIKSFHFPRGAFMAKIETIGTGTFDTVARIFGDPSQISSFCNAFHYLQFSSGKSLFYKSALNVLSLYKWRKIILTLIHNHEERQALRKRTSLVEPEESSRTESIKAAIGKKIAAVTTAKPRAIKFFVAKLLLSLVFLVAGVVVFVYSIGSVRSSTDLCSKYDKCKLTSYQWNFGAKHCTCLVFADRQTAPQTFAEWTDPVDTTENLAELATAGELRIVQIINRAVPELPEPLRKCEELEQLILAYTKIERFPEWFSEFTHLQYFHIEGDFTSRRLETIPAGSFDHMHQLMFMHLGGIPDLQELPSLSGLTSLRYLTIAIASSLATIPSFDGLSHVTDLTINHAPRVTVLPSLAPLVRLKRLKVQARIAVCCDGYISGTCDMTPMQCQAIAGEKYPLTCTDERPSDYDKAVFAAFNTTICSDAPPMDPEQGAPNAYLTDELCGGVIYKECTRDGQQGICYNTRMTVIQCLPGTTYIAMRKLQIERGVDKCNKTVEAWLGCK